MEEKANPKAQIKITFQIFIALLAGLILAAYYLFPEIESYKIDINNTEDIVMYIIPLGLIVAILLGSILFQSNIKQALSNECLSNKLATYQTGMLMRLAPLEGIAFLSIFQFSDSKNVIYLIIEVIAILYIIFLVPTKSRIIKELQLSETHKRQLN